MAVGDLKRLVQGDEIDSVAIETSVAETPEAAISEIQTGKSIFKLFGSIKKALQGCLTTSSISNNFATTDWEQVAAAPLVKELKEDVGALNDALGKIGIVRSVRHNQAIPNASTWVGVDSYTAQESGLYHVSFQITASNASNSTRLLSQLIKGGNTLLQIEAPVGQYFATMHGSAYVELLNGEQVTAQEYSSITLSEANNNIFFQVTRIK